MRFCKNNNYDIKHTLSHRDLFIEFKSEEKVDQFEDGQWFEKEKITIYCNAQAYF